MSETALYNQIGLLQQELALVKEANAKLTTERNKYRSQAIMRANKIEGLQNELQEIYSPQGN
jgi:FtsZ-binding cell division protein ZapB